MSERRRIPRHPIQVPVDLDEASAQTRDISAGGLYLYTDVDLRPGSEIHFSLVFPNTPSSFGHFRCVGHVLRVEDANEKIGVALTIDDIWFERDDGRGH
ncbi:MAG: PilZ domain-containing protein [Thermoanaerobaculia bacterium]